MSGPAVELQRLTGAAREVDFAATCWPRGAEPAIHHHDDHDQRDALRVVG